MASTAPALTQSPRLPRWLVAVLLLAALALRTARLGGDPPAVMPEATPMDEGLWADAARGKVLFDDWWADTTGNAVLIAPLHSAVQWLVYRVCGLGLWQTRLPSAIASALLCVLVGLAVGRRLDARGFATTALLLLCCPLLDQHGHMGLLESEQMAWIAAAFALLFADLPPFRRGALAGAAMACAFATKPNAATLGALPLLLAFAAEWRAAARAGLPRAHRDHLRTAAGALAGGLAAVLPFALCVWLPHQREWLEAANAEMGNDHWTLGGHLLRLGLFLDRESAPGVHRLWAPLRHAPAIAAGAWLWALGRRGRAPLPGERATAVWALATLLLVETSFMHVGRRQLLALPALGALAIYHLSAGRVDPATAATVAASRQRRFGDWLLLTLPAALLLKPWLCNFAPAIGGDAVASRYAAGLLFFAPWLLGPWLLARFDPAPWRRRVLAVGPLLVLLLFALDAAQLAVFHDRGRTIEQAQQELRCAVADGETVLGQNATLLFLDRKVRTPRRVVPGSDFATPRPNPRVFEETQPRYLLDYRGSVPAEMPDLTAHGFRPRAQAAYLREPDGSWRYELQLWERR